MATDSKLTEISADCVIVVRIAVPGEPEELERCSAGRTKVLEQRLLANRSLTVTARMTV